MKTNIRIFRVDALRKAYEAGVKSAMGDTTAWKDVFEAGEKKGSAFLNEAVNAPNFIEFMHEKRCESPGSFNSWMGQNEKKLSITVIKDQLDVAEASSEVRLLKGRNLITMYAVEEAVSHVYSITIDELRHNRRGLKKFKTPRYVCYYLAYFHCMVTLDEIADRWGQKIHGTVLWGVKQVANDASIYDIDRENLTSAYVHMLINGYDIDSLVQDASGQRPGSNRTIVKPIKIEI